MNVNNKVPSECFAGLAGHRHRSGGFIKDPRLFLWGGGAEALRRPGAEKLQWE